MKVKKICNEAVVTFGWTFVDNCLAKHAFPFPTLPENTEKMEEKFAKDLSLLQNAILTLFSFETITPNLSKKHVMFESYGSWFRSVNILKPRFIVTWNGVHTIEFPFPNGIPPDDLNRDNAVPQVRNQVYPDAATISSAVAASAVCDRQLESTSCPADDIFREFLTRGGFLIQEASRVFPKNILYKERLIPINYVQFSHFVCDAPTVHNIDALLIFHFINITYIGDDQSKANHPHNISSVNCVVQIIYVSPDTPIE